MTIRELDPATLLSVCAVLGQFDEPAVHAVCDHAPEALDQLLNAGQLVPVPHAPGMLMVPAEQRQALLYQLRRTQPQTEHSWQVCAFQYYLALLKHASEQNRASLEERCLFHLEQMFHYLAVRLEWQTLRHYLGLLAAYPPVTRRFREMLQLFEGFIAIRTGEYEHGSSLLYPLYAAPDLEPKTRLLTLVALGQMQRNLTHYDQALAYYQQLAEQAQALDQPIYYAVALVNIGTIQHELDQYESALDLVLQSLALFQKHGDLERTAYAHYSAGLNAMYLGRWELARQHYHEASTLLELLVMPATLAMSFWSEGLLNHLLGDEAASEAAFLRTIDLVQTNQRGELIAAMDAWVQLGFLYFTQSRYAEALPAYQEAMQVAEQLQYTHRRALIHYHIGRTHAAAGRPSAAEQSFRRAVAIVEALGAATTNESVKISLLGTTQQIYEALVLHLFDNGAVDEAFHYAERARSRAFLDMLARKSPELYAAFDEPVVTIAELQQGLPEDTLLVEYYTTGVLPRGDHLINHIPQENARLRKQLSQPARILRFAVTRHSFQAHALDLDPNRLRPGTGEQMPGRHLLYGRMPQALYERLLGPLGIELNQHATIYFIPHGPLHYVPFAGLQDADGRYVLHERGPALAQAPSATILLRNCLMKDHSTHTETVCIGYNDPDGEQPLQYAEAESQHLHGMLGGMLLVGPEPKIDQLVHHAATLRWLHIAGHASFDPHDPLDSALLLGTGERLSAHMIIERLTLDADMVVLSSCTSGLSHVLPGDELLGLQRAWLVAGARRLVCTRWEAVDLVTFLLMDRFYQQILSGIPPARALCNAQMAIRTMDRATAQQHLEASGIALSITQSFDEELPFARPLIWAAYMLVGRA